MHPVSGTAGRYGTVGDESRDRMLLALPLALGLLSALAIALYLYSANHAQYDFIDVIFAGPICSLVGRDLPDAEALECA